MTDKPVHKNGNIRNSFVDFTAAGKFEFKLLQRFVAGGGHMFRFPDQAMVNHSHYNLAYDTSKQQCQNRDHEVSMLKKNCKHDSSYPP